MASDREMLDRIAKLSTAIEQQKTMRGGRGGYAPRGRGGYNAYSYRGRGNGSMSLNNTAPVRPANNTYYPVNNNPYIRPTSAPVSHNRKLVLNGASSTPSPPVTTYRPPVYRPIPTPPMATYLPKSHHRKLIINHKGNSKTNNTMVKSIDATTGRKQVSIDGVDFVVKGKKLIRKDLFDSNTTKSGFMAPTNAPKILIRRTVKSAKRLDKNQNMVLGKTPIIHKRKKHIARSKGGNMVFTREPEGYVRQGRSGKSLVLNTHRENIKKPIYCGFFTRFGKCPKANHCPFKHDINRRAICPRFLQSRCKKQNTCRLSHTPNQHNMPHCVHFQKGHCTNEPCLYIHVRVGQDAAVCKAFAMEGYCPKGLECQEKHVHVCPEFAETGKCSNANCRLPHVARRTKDQNTQSGIISLRSWVSPQYYHAQKVAKAEKRKAVEEAAASKVWTRPTEEKTKEAVREREEQDGFVRLFDDSDDDDGWSQFEMDSEASGQDIKSLRFNEDEEDEEDEEVEEGDHHVSEEEAVESGTEDDEEMDDSVAEDDSDVEEIYEEISDTEMSEEDEQQLVTSA